MNLKKTKSIDLENLNKILKTPKQPFERLSTTVQAFSCSFSTKNCKGVEEKSPLLKKSPRHFVHPFHINLSQSYYQKILAPDMILKQNYRNIMEIPRLEKLILNTTSKKFLYDKKLIVFTLAALELISGQKPKCTFAHNSIANFKIRQHQILGCQSVLRKHTMYNFLDKISIMIFPRVRDLVINKKGQHKNENPLVFQKFRHKQKRVTTQNIGIQNPMIFPELEKNYDLIEGFQGMNCTFVLSHSRQKASSILLSGFQIPLH
jgi:large subunit ribosomal protein L5